MKLTVIIVNYNVKHYLEQCLDSVFRNAVAGGLEVYVVDNDSTDGSVDYLSQRFPQVKFIQNHSNVGFAYANNQAIRASESEYVLLLNPDTVIAENTLSQCVAFMDSHPKAAGTGVCMLKSNGAFAYESRRGFPSPFTSFCKMSGLCSLFPKSTLFGRYYLRYNNYHNECEIDVISGAFMFMRRTVLQQCGLLDEDFFMYGEDIDLSFRLQKSGHKNYYLPLPILHYKGESTQKNSYRYVHVFYKAMLIFFRKHYSHYSFLLSWFIQLSIYVRGVMAFFKQQQVKLKGRALQPLSAESCAPNMLILTSVHHVDDARQLMEQHHLNGMVMPFEGNVVSPEQLQTLAKGYDIVVFDASVFAYTHIFNLFVQTEEKGFAWETAYFHPHKKTIITMHNVYSDDSQE